MAAHQSLLLPLSHHLRSIVENSVCCGIAQVISVLLLSTFYAQTFTITNAVALFDRFLSHKELQVCLFQDYHDIESDI